jgi:hypothetical protein
MAAGDAGIRCVSKPGAFTVKTISPPLSWPGFLLSCVNGLFWPNWEPLTKSSQVLSKGLGLLRPFELQHPSVSARERKFNSFCAFAQ